jgi:hypothetical protein
MGSISNLKACLKLNKFISDVRLSVVEDHFNALRKHFDHATIDRLLKKVVISTGATRSGEIFD